MQSFSLSGNDTVTISGYTLTGQADGDIATVNFPNEFVKVKTGKNGNSIFAKDETGRQVDVSLRVLRGSTDDKFLNSIVASYLADPAGFVLLDGQFVKRIGDGVGNVSYDSILLDGGVPTKPPGMVENTDGNTDQSVAVYEFKYTVSSRTLM